jgi:hypothetical protein
MFDDNPKNQDVRSTQMHYFCKEIEITNKDFQVPVILGISMNEEPSSPCYHVARTGRIPLIPGIPGICKPPICQTFCRGSVRVNWYDKKFI